MTDETPSQETDETQSGVTDEAPPRATDEPAPVVTDETQAAATDEAPPAVADAAPPVQPLTRAGSAALAPVEAPDPSSAAGSAGADRPEIIVGAAFAAGFTLAMVLRRLVR